MLETIAPGALSSLDLSKVVLAIGSLGTAAYGVVDVSKCFGGGVSNRGFSDIRNVVTKFIPPSANGTETSGLGSLSALATLRANWINGMALPDQKAVAKALVKLNLTAATAEQMARSAGVDAAILTNVAEKLGSSDALSAQETDVYGRFDLMLTALLDQGYQRADQRYRNSAKLLAVPVSVLLAVLGAWALGGSQTTAADLWRALIAGLLATPLAPVAKDLSTAIQAGAKVAQSWKK